MGSNDDHTGRKVDAKGVYTSLDLPFRGLKVLQGGDKGSGIPIGLLFLVTQRNRKLLLSVEGKSGKA